MVWIRLYRRAVVTITIMMEVLDMSMNLDLDLDPELHLDIPIVILVILASDMMLGIKDVTTHPTVDTMNLTDEHPPHHPPTHHTNKINTHDNKTAIIKNHNITTPIMIDMIDTMIDHPTPTNTIVAIEAIMGTMATPLTIDMIPTPSFHSLAASVDTVVVVSVVIYQLPPS